MINHTSLNISTETAMVLINAQETDENTELVSFNLPDTKFLHCEMCKKMKKSKLQFWLQHIKFKFIISKHFS